MVGQIKVESSESFYKTRKKLEQEIEVKDEDRDFVLCEVHFGKNQVGEFWRFEDLILCYISGTRYDFVFEEELYDKLVGIHE